MSSIAGKTPASSSRSACNPSFGGTLTLGSQRSPGCVDFSDLFCDAKIICVTLDTGARVTYCNDYLLQLTGWERSEVIGQDWFELFIPPKIDDLRQLFASILIEEPLARHHENEILMRSGEHRLIRWKNSLLRSKAGEVIGTASIGEDITEQKLNQESLLQHEERTRLIVESALDAVVVIDATGCIIDWNPQAAITFGWVREDVIGSSLTETIVPDRYREAHKQALRVFLETGAGPIVNKRIELSAIHRDGHEFPIELTVSPIRHCGGWIFSSFIRDLTERKHAEQALVQLRRRSELILESVGEGIHGIDTDGRIIFENSVAAKLLGYTVEEHSGKLAHDTMHHSRKDGTPFPVEHCAIHAALHDGITRTVGDEVFWRKDGTNFPVEYTTAPIRNERNEITGAVVAFRDITDRKESENKIGRLNRVYAVLSGINTLIVRVRNRDELFKEACRIAVEQGGFRMSLICIADRGAMKIVPVASAGKDAELLTAIETLLLSSEGAPNTMVARAMMEKKAIVSNDSQSDPQVLLGERYAKYGVRSVAVLPLIASNESVGVLALYANEIEFFHEEEIKLLTDLTGNMSFALDHIEKEEKLNYLAYYDVLTGLANRSLFLERVAQYARGAANSDHSLALILFDLERFKSINDSLGVPAGDALLRQVAEWLTRMVGDASLLARLGSDHFAVVLPQLKQGQDVRQFVEKAMDGFLDHPFRLNDAVFRISAKAGIALFPDHGAKAETLFKNAEAALKNAKSTGEPYLLYTQKMSAGVAGKVTLENKLRRAIDNEEFVLYYQPKVNLLSGKLTGAEALLRWNDPETGLVAPGRFIPVLEETGLIHEVGRWAMRKAIEDYLRWRDAGTATVRIAVNVSPLQLRNRSFLAEIERAINVDARAAASGLELEITEGVIMGDVKHSISTLQAIRKMGITVAIDDFGTGFSSLSYLAKLPVDTVKVDRSFVVDMTSAPSGLSLMSAIISLAHSLNLNVVAEGVETDEQSRLLRLLGCDEMQGFLFSKPVPSEIFESRYLALESAAFLS
jgi:diguanylate cyclase (GGDEF)-like protein/PAS domain S-box-containing protein